jgi:hypothetical protein
MYTALDCPKIMVMTLTPIYSTDKYTYRVLWSEDHQRYVGVCSEFSGLSYEAKTHDDALTGIIARVTSEVANKRKAGEEVPVPISIQQLKGAAR